MRINLWMGGIVAVAIAGAAVAQDDTKALFQARYDSFRAAMTAQDTSAASAMLAPGYQMTDIQGNTYDASGLETMRSRMAGMAAGGAAPTTTVIEAAITGDTANVKQRLNLATKRPGPDGNEMNLAIELISNDTWVKVGDAWLLKASVQKDLVVKRDGEVFFKQSN